jgi:4-nitrophenyl phosphatase
LHALRLVSKRLGIPMRRVAVVGDDPLVEMIMSRRGGAMGFGVTTGFTTAEDWAAQPLGRRPHRVVRDLGEILEIAVSS